MLLFNLHKKLTKNKFTKYPSEINEKLYKRERNKCVSVRKKTQRNNIFSNITSKGFVTHRKIWKTMKPFLANKSRLDNSDIILSDNNEMITDGKHFVKHF